MRPPFERFVGQVVFRELGLCRYEEAVLRHDGDLFCFGDLEFAEPDSYWVQHGVVWFIFETEGEVTKQQSEDYRSELASAIDRGK